MQNFGKIHETFKNILVNGVVDKAPKDRAIFKTYLKQLKENKTLKTQYQIFNKLEHKIHEDVEESKLLVDECISVLSNLGKDAVNEVNNKLVKFLTKHGYKLTTGYDSESLHEHIAKLAFSDKNALTINSIVESKLYLIKYTNLNVIKEAISVEPYANRFLGPVMVEKFNNKYLGLLSELERKAVKLMINGKDEDRQEFFKSSVTECIDLVNTRLNEECTIDEKEKYLQVKDKLLRYQYDADAFMSEISKITFLKNTLN